MNPFEKEWYQLKAHQFRRQMFEYELDLAYAVMDGMNARANGETKKQKDLDFHHSLLLHEPFCTVIFKTCLLIIRLKLDGVAPDYEPK